MTGGLALAKLISMRAEIIAVGTELLLGDVTNTNAVWLSKELAAMGIDVYYHLSVGDNPERIQGVIQQAIERPHNPSDLLIFTGGLGPTDDDLTIATIADYFKTPLVSDPESEATIRAFFLTRDTPMSPTNIKQALKPDGAETINNPIGTAPGIAWDVSDKTGKPTYILTFPGVPRELYVMWPQGKAFIEDIQRQSGEMPFVLSTLFMHFFGIGESLLAERLKDLMTQSNPTVAPYVGNAEVKIRVVAKAKTDDEAQNLIAPVKQEILKRCEEYYYGDNEATLESTVGQLLTEKKRTVSVAESCTGGLVSSRLTDVPGSSAYTHLNVVTYANEKKQDLLGVDSATLSQFGAVSAEVAEQMAIGAKKLSGCDIGLALTGIAGPDGGTEDKPVGLVYVGLCGVDGKTHSQKVLANPKNKRADIKYWFSQYGLNVLRHYLLSLK